MTTNDLRPFKGHDEFDEQQLSDHWLLRARIAHARLSEADE